MSRNRIPESAESSTVQPSAPSTISRFNDLDYIDPQVIQVHEYLSALPALPSDAPEFLALEASIKDLGVCEPLKVIFGENEEVLLIDGRHRLRAAKRLGLSSVPVIVVPPNQAQTIALTSLSCRRHYSKAQICYVLFPLLEPAFLEAGKRRIQNLNHTKSIERNSVPFDEKGLDEWADQLGVSARYIRQAKELRDLFRDKTKRVLRSDKDRDEQIDVTFQEFWEPKLLRTEDPLGFGGVLTAIKQVISIEEKGGKGIEHTGGAPKGAQEQLDLFARGWETVGKRFSYWTGWDDDTKKSAVKTIAPIIGDMPDDLLNATSKQIKAEIRRRRVESGS
jgi:hypothetical protein